MTFFACLIKKHNTVYIHFLNYFNLLINYFIYKKFIYTIKELFNII